MLRESSGSTEETENKMTRALQIILEHSQLRSATDMDDLVIDEVERPKIKDLCDGTTIYFVDSCTKCCVFLSQNGPELLPRVSMLLLLTRIISTAAPRLQVTEEFKFRPFTFC